MQLCGDIPIHDVAAHFRCEKCKHKTYLQAGYFSIYGPDIGKISLRRLVRVKVIHKPIWRDETI
ncbi:hypothetical protein AX761_22055 [Rhizobium sp. 58]|nr:hypothetical protein AX761_22055 [Rhizobium sp. 58]